MPLSTMYIAHYTHPQFHIQSATAMAIVPSVIMMKMWQLVDNPWINLEIMKVVEFVKTAHTIQLAQTVKIAWMDIIDRLMWIWLTQKGACVRYTLFPSAVLGRRSKTGIFPIIQDFQLVCAFLMLHTLGSFILWENPQILLVRNPTRYSSLVLLGNPSSTSTTTHGPLYTLCI